jgi:flagellar biogenesis protein FliO
MSVSREEYQQAKRIHRVSMWLIFIMIFILPLASAYTLKQLIPEHAGGVTMVFSAVSIIAVASIGTFDTVEESGQIIEKYKKGH